MNEIYLSEYTFKDVLAGDKNACWVCPYLKEKTICFVSLKYFG